MTDWPEYESHKVVRAAKIVRVDRNHGGGRIVSAIFVDPGTGALERFEPDVPEMGEKAVVGGYAVIYDGGYQSISPAKAFEEGYTRKA